MLKGIISGEEKDIKRIPIKVDNEYKEGWEVRDNQDRLIWGREDTFQITNGIFDFKGYGIPLKIKSFFGNGQQTGTPTPDNPIQPEFCGDLVDTDWMIPITCAGQITPVYLGQTQTVRRIKKLVLTGWEAWNTYLNTYYIKVTNYYNMYDIGRHLSVCTHYPDEQMEFVHEMHYGLGGLIDGRTTTVWNGNIVFNPSPMISSRDDWKSYLAAQYAAGTPVTVWYVLATPETGIVNEPLAKLGDYADELSSEDAGVSIPTVTGLNTLTVDTTLAPSSLVVKGHAKKIY